MEDKKKTKEREYRRKGNQEQEMEEEKKEGKEMRGDMVESRIVLDVQVMSVTFFC